MPLRGCIGACVLVLIMVGWEGGGEAGVSSPVPLVCGFNCFTVFKLGQRMLILIYPTEQLTYRCYQQKTKYREPIQCLLAIPRTRKSLKHTDNTD